MFQIDDKVLTNCTLEVGDSEFIPEGTPGVIVDFDGENDYLVNFGRDLVSGVSERQLKLKPAMPIDLSQAQPTTKSLQAIREGGLATLWFAAINLQGEGTILIGSGGKPTEYLIQPEAMAAAIKFMDSRKVEAIPDGNS